MVLRCVGVVVDVHEVIGLGVDVGVDEHMSGGSGGSGGGGSGIAHAATTAAAVSDVAVFPTGAVVVSDILMTLVVVALELSHVIR